MGLGIPEWAALDVDDFNLSRVLWRGRSIATHLAMLDILNPRLAVLEHWHARTWFLPRGMVVCGVVLEKITAKGLRKESYIAYPLDDLSADCLVRFDHLCNLTRLACVAINSRWDVADLEGGRFRCGTSDSVWPPEVREARGRIENWRCLGLWR